MSDKPPGEAKPYDLGRPKHLLAKDVVKRVEDYLWRNGIKVKLGRQPYADVEQLIAQLYEEIEKEANR